MELRRGARGVVCVAHRGGAALARESSLAAIEASAGCGADAVELDVHEGLVVAHDRGGRHDAPSLDDALALAARLGLAVQLDVKAPGLERPVVAALGRHDLLDRSFVSSPSAGVLRAFAAVEGGLPRAFTYPEDRLGATGSTLLRPAVPAALAVLRALLPRRLPGLLDAARASAATLNWAVVTTHTVDVCHRLGAAVYVWTVNDPALARTLVESGIDGIITDDPRLLPAGIDRTT
jgi:glycerophosphoryl diester phosphodiesterase